MPPRRMPTRPSPARPPWAPSPSPRRDRPTRCRGRSRLRHPGHRRRRPRHAVGLADATSGDAPQHRTPMPRSKSSAFNGTASINAMVARVAPDILALLVDGRPRTKAVIVAALAGRHAEDDVALTLVRLAVAGQVEEAGGKYTLASGPGPDVG